MYFEAFIQNYNWQNMKARLDIIDYDTPFVNTDAEEVNNEVQVASVDSEANPEIQVFSFNLWLK